MSDKKNIEEHTDPEKSQPEDEASSSNSPNPEKVFDDISFARREDELQFYNTPLLKKEHLSIILGSAAFLIALCVFFIGNTLSFGDKIEPIRIYDSLGNDMGIYDPSLAYDAKQQQAWMAYSSIHKRRDGQAPNININIASSNDQGKRWQYNQTIFAGKKDLLSDEQGNIVDIEGVWRYETPALVYDPDDPEHTWKIYAYKYFWTGDNKEARKYSVITYKTSPNIAKKKWSKEEWLFSAGPGQPPAPYGSLILLHLNKLHPSLKNMLYYAEPGVIYYKDTLLMTLTAYHKDNTPDRIILIGSRDHGQSWLFLGTLITSKQAQHYGSYTRVDSSSMAEHQGKLYLMVSFGDQRITHQGTYVFTMDNFIKSSLQKDKSGWPKVAEYIPPPFPDNMTILGAGQSTYHEEIKGGVLIPQMVLSSPERPFRIYKTKKALFE